MRGRGPESHQLHHSRSYQNIFPNLKRFETLSNISVDTTEETDVEAFEFSDYDQVPLRSVLVNNGHSAKLSSEFLS